MRTMTEAYLGYSITLSGQRVGNGWHLLCHGGSQPHVGGVSLAQPYWGSNGNITASVSSISIIGHKDTELGNWIAGYIAKRTGLVTVVVCGIHFEDISKAEISAIMDIGERLCSRFLEGEDA